MDSSPIVIMEWFINIEWKTNNEHWESNYLKDETPKNIFMIYSD